MKKQLAFVTMLLMIVSLLAGCSPDEMTFLKLNQEISSLDTYTMTGSFDWNADLEALMGDSQGTDPATLESQREFLRIANQEGLKHITFSYGVDLKKMAMEAHYSAGNTPLFTLILIKDTYYVNFDGLLELVKRNDTEALQDTALYGNLEALKGKYLTVSIQDLVESGLSPSKLIEPAQFQDSLVQQQALRKTILNTFIDFAQTELAGYDTGVVEKTYDSSLQADVYGYSVNLDQVPLITLEFILTLLNHLDSTEAMVTKIVSDPAIAAQAGTDSARMVTEVKSGFEQIRSNLATAQLEVSAMIAQEKSTAALGSKVRDMAGTTTVDCRIAKIGPDKYWNQFQIAMNHPTGQYPVKKASLAANLTVDGSKAPVITVPTALIPFNTFNESLPHTLILEPDMHAASYEAGVLPARQLDADMKNIGGHWFISTRSLPARFQSLVKQAGAQVAIGGKPLSAPESLYIAGDTTYVSVSAFAHAGILPVWNAEDRTLTLKN